MTAARPGGSRPILSVVVTIVDGGEALRRFLGALRAQAGGPPLEVIVPFDASAGSMAELSREFPECTFLDLGGVPTTRAPETASGQHELYDRRRAAGLAAARGDLVAILEDRGIPRPDWSHTAVRLHGLHPFGVIGGAIEPAGTSLLAWAFWVCDFSRYGLPFTGGPARWVSDVNVTYKRAALEQTRHLWRERYQEPVVHWALTAAGETTYLSPELVVRHHLDAPRLGPLLPQRFAWGRLFGAIRARHTSTARRVALAAVSPALPLVLLVRHGRTQFRRGEGGRFLRAIPLLLALLTAWTAGEAWGTITGRD